MPEMFDTSKRDLREILRQADQGSLQLPDFQRDYVWGEPDVISLIASIANGFPVGALLTLEAGGPVRFQPRLLEGVPPTSAAPTELLLDGQQRITSLYQSLLSQRPVQTKNAKGKRIQRYFYLSIDHALGQPRDFESAIIPLPEDRIVRGVFGKPDGLDLSTEELEFETNHFPLNRVFDYHNWLYRWVDYWKRKGCDKFDLLRKLDQEVLDVIARYKMPIIQLSRENEREAICLVFEKVNVGGKKLDAFELVTAIYAADNFKLREDWNGTLDGSTPGRHREIMGTTHPMLVLQNVSSTDFLQACTLVSTRALRLAKEAQKAQDAILPQISCRRDAILSLALAEYQKFAPALTRGFAEAGRLLNSLNITSSADIPYPPQITGLAALYAILGDEALTAPAREKILQWFWCAALGELYGSGTETKLARDIPALADWIRGGEQRPLSIDDAIFQQDRLNYLRIRISAAYKAIHCLLISRGCHDFIEGTSTNLATFYNDPVDIHHIFPQAWCRKVGIPPATFNSIINKTPLTSGTNRIIGGQAPSVYLRKIEERHRLSSAALDSILRTHLIEPELLRKDDFEGFYQQRKEALSQLIEQAMGKPVVREVSGDNGEPDDGDYLNSESEEQAA